MTYRFTNVPEALWMRLQGASSKGKFFARNIKGRFHYARWTGATWRGQGALKNDSAKRKLARLRAKVRGRS